MKRLVPVLIAAALLPGCDQTPQPPRVTVEEAVVTLPAVPGRAGGAYFTLRTNHEATRLTGIESERVGRIELHETVDEGGISRMQALPQLSFSPGEPAVFAPGGRHAMLFEMDRSLRPGDRLSLTFRFDPAPAVTVEAEVRGPGGAHAEH